MTNLQHITYRVVRDMESLHQMIDLQRLIWGENAEAHVPLHMLHSLAQSGAPLIGAFDGDLLVGFSLSFFGLDVVETDRPALANLKLASKRLAVHPDYRDSGIGYQMKLEQKKFANKQGIRLITWTYDPLISRNAYLYIRKLGGMVRRFIQDYYAEMPGQVSRIPGTDRFLIEWWVTSRRVEERINGTRRGLTVEDYLSANTPIINPAYPRPDRTVAPFLGKIVIGDHSLLLVEVPPENHALANDPELGALWREHTRQAFTQAFQAGYIVTDFLHQSYEGYKRSFYVMGFDGG